MKHDFLVYLSHSWGTSPEQKKKEHEYNVEYYRENKEKWKKYREERLKELDDEDKSIQRSRKTMDAAWDHAGALGDKLKNYEHTLRLLKKQLEKETDQKRRSLLQNQISGLNFTASMLANARDIALETALEFDRGTLAYDTDGDIYRPSTRSSINSRQAINDRERRWYNEEERWEDPYAARERDRAKAYGENEKAKLEAQRKKSKK